MYDKLLPHDIRILSKGIFKVHECYEMFVYQYFWHTIPLQFLFQHSLIYVYSWSELNVHCMYTYLFMAFIYVACLFVSCAFFAYCDFFDVASSLAYVYYMYWRICIAPCGPQGCKNSRARQPDLALVFLCLFCDVMSSGLWMDFGFYVRFSVFVSTMLSDWLRSLSLK